MPSVGWWPKPKPPPPPRTTASFESRPSRGRAPAGPSTVHARPERGPQPSFTRRPTRPPGLNGSASGLGEHPRDRHELLASARWLGAGAAPLSARSGRVFRGRLRIERPGFVPACACSPKDQSIFDISKIGVSVVGGFRTARHHACCALTPFGKPDRVYFRPGAASTQSQVRACTGPRPIRPITRCRSAAGPEIGPRQLDAP